MDQFILLSTLLLVQLLLSFQLRKAKCATVPGCDGYLCSTSDHSNPLFNNEDDAILFSRCHASCLESIATGVQKQIARAGNTAWPFIPFKTLDDNCIEMRKIMECRRSCIIRFRNPGINRGTCRTRCKEQCMSECPSNMRCYYNGTVCSFNCRARDGCRAGCDITLSNLDMTLPLVNPRSIPILIIKNTEIPRPAGDYALGNYQVPENNETTNTQLSVFIFKISTAANISYKIQTSPSDEAMDLSSLACQHVNVSFAVVTTNKISQYSPTTSSICVQGATRYPQLNNKSITYSITLDSRPGYGDNAVVNLSWTRPTEYHLIDHYHLVIYTNKTYCKSISGKDETENYRRISGDASSFEMKAMSPDRYPHWNCVYNYTLQVIPNNTDYSNRGIINITSPEIPKLNLTCMRTHVNESTGLISTEATWRIPNPIKNKVFVQAIDAYSVIYEDGNQTITQSVEHGSHSQDGLLPSNNEETRIKITIIPILRLNTTPYKPPDESCFLSTTPLPPTPIKSNSIKAHQLIYDPGDIQMDQPGRIELNLTWDDPKKPYGRIINYQVRILRQREKVEDNITAVEILQSTTDIQPGDIIQEDEVYLDEDTFCIFVQVRARNEFHLWSNWSIATSLALYPNTHHSCEIIQPSSLLSAPAWSGISVGISLVLFMVCALCLSLCICICKRHRMKVQMRRAFENGYSNPMFVAGGRALQRNNGSLRVPLTLTTTYVDEWEIPVGSVIVEDKFGEGCFGEVHKGVVKGPLPSTRTMKSNICVAVAIKMLKTTATGSERTDFLHEIETMKKIAHGNNPHVISFIGCVTVQEPLCLITEFVKYGDLLSYLETIRKLITHQNRQRNLSIIQPEPYLEPKHQQEKSAAAMVEPKRTEGEKGIIPAAGTLYAELGVVDPVNLISFAYQIASGMEYLSSLDIVHRDLACRNILIGENKNLRISDFGMSRVVTGDDIYVKTTKGRLPWKWMAIESIVNREFTHASDVWSYGVTLWEIATLGGFPYPMITNAELLEHLKSGHRLECPDNCSPEIYKVMLECWSDDPNDRKTFPKLRSLFDAMLAEDNPYIQFEGINTHKPYYNARSQRSSRFEEEIITTSSELDTEFEASSTSIETLNEVSVTGAYDFLRPIATTAEVSDTDVGHGIPTANPYVETPTFKFLMNQDNFELSNFDLDLEVIQQSDEMESSSEVQDDINSTTKCAHLVE